jgi:bacterioferritin (cytochrome b1)
MPNRTKEELAGILESFISDEERAEAEYERAIKLANEAGFPEVAVGLRQIRKDTKNHRDVLEFMLLGLKSEDR